MAKIKNNFRLFRNFEIITNQITMANLINSAEETWKDIPDYEGYYQASTNGRIRAYDRLKKYSDGKCHILKSYIMKQRLSTCGYWLIGLNKNGIKKDFKVHRLIALTFAPNPGNKPFVNHKDFDPTNNNIDNLEWVTPKENIQYSLQRGRYDEHRKVLDHLSSIRVRIMNEKRSKSILQLDLDGNVIKKWKNIREIVENGVAKSHSVYHVCAGKRQTTRGYKWRYA